jgi:phage-related protein
MAIGDAYVDIHGNMDPLDRDLAREAGKIERDADREFKDAGEAIGESMADSASAEFGRHGRDFGRRLQEDIRARPIRVRQKVDVDLDYDVDRVGSEIHRAVSEAISPGGPIDIVGRKLGLALGDAFGAGFGVSGRSALIPFIVLLVGVIVALVLAAVQAVNALVAMLTTIPALLLAVGLQVGVLVLAFKGMGTAISGAFAAKNAKELNEAIKDLTPSAQAFVKTLLPLRDLFKYLRDITQEAFFKELGPIISELQAALGATLGFKLGDLAAALGRFARSFALVFASPSFQKLLDEIIPATVRWLDKFGPGFAAFLIGWIDLANASLPFFEKLGGGLASVLQKLGEWFTEISKSPEFQEWLDDMYETLKAVGDLLLAASQFVASFMDALNKEGGTQLIKDLAREFVVLAEFFQSEAGQKGMRAFLVILTGILVVTSGLILLIFTFLGAVQAFFDFLVNEVGPAIGDFFSWLGETIAGGFDGISAAGLAAKTFLLETVESMKASWRGLQESVTNRITSLIETAKSIPGRIKDALGNLKDLLFQAGRSLIQGLIDGIRSMFGALGNTAGNVVSKITAFLPGSPAEEGPLSGEGYALTRGRHLIQDLVKGIQMEVPAMRTSTENAVSNITFGPGSVSVGFQGVVPTPEQARVTGAAAGQGILGQLAARNIRLAVRTL